MNALPIDYEQCCNDRLNPPPKADIGKPPQRLLAGSYDQPLKARLTQRRARDPLLGPEAREAVF